MGSSLSGTIIPRRVRRMFDQREEPRVDPDHDVAILSWRGKTRDVRVGNVSSVGVTLWFDTILRIGEDVAVQMLDGEPRAGQVRWVRDGRVGIDFSRPRP